MTVVCGHCGEQSGSGGFIHHKPHCATNIGIDLDPSGRIAALEARVAALEAKLAEAMAEGDAT